MIGLDTNVLLRFIIRDDEDQAQRARTLIMGNAVFVSVTALLETEWVLRSGYGFSPSDINNAIRQFMLLDTVTIEHSEAAARALDAMLIGFDFADALHVETAGSVTRFATFDKQLIKKRIGQPPEVLEP